MCFRQATETEEKEEGEEKERGRKPQPARTLVGVGNEKMGRDKQQTKRGEKKKKLRTHKENNTLTACFAISSNCFLVLLVK